MTPPPRCVAILGLGLIGGSVARDLARFGVRILGYDRDPATLDAATDAGVVHGIVDPSSLALLRDADALLLAVPVDAAPAALATVRTALDEVPLITDVGSTKRAIGAAAESLGLGPRFVGAHPLAGDHRSGWAASREGMFRETQVYLCPTATTSDDAFRRARTLWESLGATTETVDATTHDRRLAWTSHLPQALATALAHSLGSAGLHRRDLGPGGRDMTRLASSNPDVWTAIALENADSLVDALAAVTSRLDTLRAALTAHDRAAIHRFFTTPAAWARDQ